MGAVIIAAVVDVVFVVVAVLVWGIFGRRARAFIENHAPTLFARR
jgi:hypothetical protein